MPTARTVLPRVCLPHTVCETSTAMNTQYCTMCVKGALCVVILLLPATTSRSHFRSSRTSDSSMTQHEEKSARQKRPGRIVGIMTPPSGRRPHARRKSRSRSRHFLRPRRLLYTGHKIHHEDPCKILLYSCCCFYFDCIFLAPHSLCLFSSTSTCSAQKYNVQCLCFSSATTTTPGSNTTIAIAQQNPSFIATPRIENSSPHVYHYN